VTLLFGNVFTSISKFRIVRAHPAHVSSSLRSLLSFCVRSSLIKS
jgi:hypothetical protein